MTDQTKPEDTSKADTPQAETPAGDDAQSPLGKHLANPALWLASLALALTVALGVWITVRGNTTPTDTTATVSTDALDKLEERISEIETRVAEAIDAQIPGDRLKKIERRLDDITSKSENSKTTQAVGELTTKTVGLESRIEVLEKNLPNESIIATAQDAQAQATRNTAAIDQLMPRVGTLDAKFELLETRLQRTEQVRAGALAMALSNLSRAVEQATPFRAELETVTALAGASQATDGLSTYADRGIETRSTLIARFERVARETIHARTPVSERGLLDKLADNARSLITVRPVGEVAGDTTEAIVARMEQRLATGDLHAAVTEAETLKGPARDTAQPWIDEAKARLAVETFVRVISAQTLAELGTHNALPE